MNLLDLPLDVIYIIISELERDATASDFLHLALTCRLFRNLVIHLIPRNVTLLTPSRNYKAFLRSVKTIPGYASRVYSYRALPNTNPRAPCLEDVLWLLPNLRILQCSFISLQSHRALCFLNIPMRNTLVKISDISTDFGLFFAIIALPNLRRLKCTLQEEIVGDIPRIKSGLEELEIHDESFHCTSQKFQELVAHVPVLTALKCNLPYVDTHDKKPILMNNFRNILFQISRTLTTLELFTGIYRTNRYAWGKSDYGTLDLHEFPVLQKISASAILFVGASMNDTPASVLRKDYLYTRLPRSLETFCLSFCYDTKIFYSTRIEYLPRPGDPPFLADVGIVDYEGRQRFLAKALRQDEYSWILNLSLERSDYLPNLRSVTLYEVTYWHAQSLKFEAWDPPKTVRSAYADAEITLNVQVRAPIARLSNNIDWEWANVPTGVQVNHSPQYQDAAV